jgi:hypothetical protein
MAKCKTVSKGEVEVEGVEGTVFHRMYESHQRGPAIFFNNRRGGKVTVYPEAKSLFDNRVKPAVERKFKSEKRLNAAVIEILNSESNDDE